MQYSSRVTSLMDPTPVGCHNTISALCHDHRFFSSIVSTHNPSHSGIPPGRIWISAKQFAIEVPEMPPIPDIYNRVPINEWITPRQLLVFYHSLMPVSDHLPPCSGAKATPKTGTNKAVWCMTFGLLCCCYSCFGSLCCLHA